MELNAVTSMDMSIHVQPRTVCLGCSAFVGSHGSKCFLRFRHAQDIYVRKTMRTPGLVFEFVVLVPEVFKAEIKIHI